MNSQIINIIRKIDGFVVEHARYRKLYKKLYRSFVIAEVGGVASNHAFFANSRWGKSFVSNSFLLDNPPIERDWGTEIPVLVVTIPVSPTVNSLVTDFLYYLGDPKHAKGSTSEKITRLRTLLAELKVRLIIFDEFQHFIDRSREKVIFEASDFLKTIIDACNAGVVVTGLPRAANVFKKNEQFEARFNTPEIMQYHNWEIDDDREEFLDILNTYQEIFSEFSFPDLCSDQFGIRMYCASLGSAGLLAKLMRETMLEAAFEDRYIVTLDDFREAYANTFWKDGKFGYTFSKKSPFDKSFLMQVQPEVIAEQRQCLDREHEENPNKPGINIALQNLVTSSQLLTTRT